MPGRARHAQCSVKALIVSAGRRVRAMVIEPKILLPVASNLSLPPKHLAVACSHLSTMALGFDKLCSPSGEDSGHTCQLVSEPTLCPIALRNTGKGRLSFYFLHIPKV